MNHPPDSERAISDVFGAVILIGVIVTVLALAGVMAFSQPHPQKIPALNARIWNDTAKIYIKHDGGDSLTSGELQIQVDNTFPVFNLTTAPALPWETLSIGNTLQTSMISSSQFPTVQIIYTGYGSSAIVLASYGLVGTSYGTIPTTPVPPAPVTAGFTGTPTSGVRPLAVQFTDASTGPVTSWSWTFGDGSTSTVQSPLYTYPDAGTYSVSLTVSNGTGTNTLTRTNYITATVLAPAPTVTARSNATLYRGWPGYELITGTGFVSGATSILNTTTGASITSTTCDVRFSTQMFCSYNLLGATVSPSYRVAVINPDGQSGLMTGNLVSVASPAPTLTARNPTTAPRGWPVSVTLTGTNFQPGATVNMTRSGSTPINAYNVVVSSPTSITCTFDLVGATAATNWAIRVTNPDLQLSGTQTFTVTKTVTVTSITPASGQRGTTVTITNIAGTGFQPGVTQVRFSRNTGTQNQILLTNINVESSTKISGTLVIPPGQTIQTLYVRVTNADATTGISGSRIFTVTA
ncbi:MAG: PKD domain-containing protein [Methanoregula sp.]|nr:PKD domain-containing protein [Methanoregula sp.]